MLSRLGLFMLAPAILAAVVLACNTAEAETHLIVPFSFTAAGKQCHAGEYKVDKGPLLNTVKLTSADATRSFVWVASPGDPSPTDQRAILTFDSRGEMHILRTVQMGSLITSRLDKPGKEYIPVRVIGGK